MMKKILTGIVTLGLVTSIALSCGAVTPSNVDEKTNRTITSWGMLEDKGFFVSSGQQSPYYGWLYTPGGDILMEGYIDFYEYYAAKGYASIHFVTANGTKDYYANPSNIIMEWRGE